MRKPVAPKPSLSTLIDRERDALDQLSAELSQGFRNQGQFDECEARARGIAQGIIAAFRGGRETATR